MKRLPEEVNMVLKRLSANGFHPYLVGGCVRDLLMGKEPSDYDMTSDAIPQEVMDLFGGRAHPTGIRHGTVSVSIGERTMEITTMRSDGAYQDLRHPETVTFTDRLELDLARRDFTVNAMALSPDGTLVDLYDGQRDLQHGILRTVGLPQERFAEDALRILRLLRFASRFGFTVEEETAKAAHQLKDNLKSVAFERVCAELNRMLCGEAVEKILLTYSDVLGVVLPEILPSVGFDQRNPHHAFDVWTHTAKAVANIPPEPVLRWTMLFHDLGKPYSFTVDENGVGHTPGHTARSRAMAAEMMKRLHFDRAAMREVDALLTYFDDLFLPTHEAVYRETVRVGKERMALLLLTKMADSAAKASDTAAEAQTRWIAAKREYEALLTGNACFTVSDLCLSGNDLKAIGFTGRDIGAVLQKLLQEVVKGRLVNEKSALSSRAGRLFRSGFSCGEKEEKCLQ